MKRDEVEEEREGAKSLAQVEVEKLEAMDRRERHDEAEDDDDDEVEVEVAVVEVVFVEAKEGANEARPRERSGGEGGREEGERGERKRVGRGGEAYATRWSERTCAGSDGAGVLPAGRQCGA